MPLTMGKEPMGKETIGKEVKRKNMMSAFLGWLYTYQRKHYLCHKHQALVRIISLGLSSPWIRLSRQ